MTSSVDIFSAANRKGGRMGGPAGWSSVEEGQTEKAPRSFADGEKHAPDMETSGILLVASQGASVCIWGGGARELDHSLT